MIKLLIGGDFCPHKQEDLEKDKFSALREINKTIDYSIVNLECPIELNQDRQPIKKIGPSLRTGLSGLNILKDIGINAVTLANNHFKDYGSDGCKDTIEYLQKNNIDYVGGGRDIEEAGNIMLKVINNTKIALINCCEEEFSIATEDEAGSNPINTIKQFYDIKDAKGQADIVIVIVHGGIEMYNLPTPKMQERYRFFIDCGADMVINHHQHCFSGMEIYQGKPIYYGLGNLYFPSLANSSRAWSEGFMVMVNIDNNSIINTQQIPYVQSFENGIIVGDSFNFEERFLDLGKICQDPNEIKKYYYDFIKKDERTYKFINPYNNRILRGAARRGWIPSFVSKNSYLELLGKIRCESHKDRYINLLTKYINK